MAPLWRQGSGHCALYLRGRGAAVDAAVGYRFPGPLLGGVQIVKPKRSLQPQKRRHNAFNLSTVAIQIKHPLALRLRKALLIEKHLVKVLFVVYVSS